MTSEIGIFKYIVLVLSLMSVLTVLLYSWIVSTGKVDLDIYHSLANAFIIQVLS